jgi:hypothetical protein
VLRCRRRLSPTRQRDGSIAATVVFVPPDIPTSLDERLNLNQRGRIGRIHMVPPEQEQIVARSKRLVEQAKSVCEQSRYARETAVAAGERAKALMRRISEDSRLAADATRRSSDLRSHSETPGLPAAEKSPGSDRGHVDKA